MTEKRFRYYEEENGEVPFPYIKDSDGKDIISLYQCYECMNALHEENVKLQARNKYLATKIQRERNSHMKQHEKWENEIQKENEQLKAQLYCNPDGGVCSICKHCYLEEQSLYYISKCEKGHKKCSKEDLRYCDDFELKGDFE